MFLENSFYSLYSSSELSAVSLLELFIKHGNPDVFFSAGKGISCQFLAVTYNRASGNEVKESILGNFQERRMKGTYWTIFPSSASLVNGVWPMLDRKS
jgi:hypothetical protein